MAGQMTTSKLFPFMTQSTAEDANGATFSGIYRVGSTSTNTPLQYGVLVVFKYGEYITQLFMAVTQSRLFFRYSSNTGASWSEWDEK